MTGKRSVGDECPELKKWPGHSSHDTDLTPP